MSLPANDPFTPNVSYQDLTAYSANWTHSQGSMFVPSGGGFVEGGGSGYNTAYWNADTFANDQFSQVVMNTGAISGISCGPAARVVSDAGYHADHFSGTLYLSKRIGGSEDPTLTTFSITLADGDVLRLEVATVSGNAVLKVFRALAASPTSFSQVGSDYTDSTSPLLSGSAGVFIYGSNFGIGPTSWAGGDLGGGGSSSYAYRRRNINTLLHF